MERFERRGRDEAEEGEGYFASMSDLMAGVLFLFIIMLAFFALQLRQTAEAPPGETALELPAIVREQKRTEVFTGQGASAPSVVDARKAALEAIAARMAAAGVDVEVDTGAGTLRLKSEPLFNGDQMTPQGLTAAQALGRAMGEVLPCYAYSPSGPPAGCPKADRRLAAVFVEAHTDLGADAWTASTNQAGAVFRELSRAAPGLNQLLDRPVGETGSQPILSVAGYGDSRPTTIGTGFRAVDRRIEVRLALGAR